jgi:hypothetical protein
LPVCLVTDNPDKAESFGVFDFIKVLEPATESNERNYSDETVGQFKNHLRFMAFEMTPFTETIIVDSDYLVCSDQLSVLWGCEQDFLIGHRAVSLDGDDLTALVAENSIYSTWATIIYFKHTPYARRVFRTVEYVAYCYQYFKQVYNLQSDVYRNDYSFAIALHMLNNGLELSNHRLPFSLFTAGEKEDLIAMDGDTLTVRNYKHNGPHDITVSGTDLHVINKYSLLDRIKEQK